MIQGLSFCNYPLSNGHMRIWQKCDSLDFKEDERNENSRCLTFCNVNSYDCKRCQPYIKIRHLYEYRR